MTELRAKADGGATKNSRTAAGMFTACALTLLAALACAHASHAAPRQAAGTGPAQAQAAPSDSERLSALLAYEAKPAPEIKVTGTEARDGVTVEDVTFEGSGGAPVAAYLVRPSEGRGAYAGVLFVHWFAPPHPNSNRTQFLEEARALARRGAVSLLVSTFWSDPARYRARRWQDDYQNTLSQARDLRRALDVLLSRPGVDAARVAYVGHDYGAMFGALLSGADARPKAYALIAGAARFPDWYLYGSASGVPAGAELESFRRQFAPLDPVSAVRLSKAAFLFQYGEDDRYTPRENFVELYLAAPTPKRLATYASDHPMDAEAVRRDRSEWLAERLRLAPSAPPPAAAGQDGLWGVLGMRVDAARRVLWVNSVAGPEAGEARGSSGVFKYDLKTGRLLKKYVLPNKPRTHLLNDVALNSRGDAFITDSEEGSVHVIRAARDELETLVPAGRFIYPNGITLSADERRLYVADFTAGLSVVDAETGAVKVVEYPEGVTVHGVDGLYFYRGSLVAIQNMRGPGRVVRLLLSREGDRVESARVVEAFNPLFDIPTTGALVGDELFYIANSQLRKINDAGVIPAGTPLVEVRVLRAKL